MHFKDSFTGEKGYITSELRPSPFGPSRKYYEITEEAIGMPYQEFCREMITAFTELEIPIKYRRLRVTGTLLMIGGVYNLIVALLALYGGVKGRLKCGDAKEAGKCFWCGAVLLGLHTAALIWDIATMIRWQTWGAARIFVIIYAGSLVLIFTTLILYTTAASQNRKAG